MNQRFSAVKSSELLNEAQRESKQGAATRHTATCIDRQSSASRRYAMHVLLIAITLGLSACGQKGDLYLPDEKPEQTKR